jgi:DNA topoisomerase VI subunit B
MAAMPNSTASSFTRETFEISRALEFFTERELSMQIGVDRHWWLHAIAKELMDNGLDACEAAGVAPKIEVILAQNAITVQDNGPGIPPETLRRSLNYLTRTSDKLLYVSPTRGQLGNALKILWAIPYVISGSNNGLVEVGTRGRLYRVEVTLDTLRQEPRIALIDVGPFVVQTGTRITIHWPHIASCQYRSPALSLYNSVPLSPVLEYLLGEFSALNPHATYTLHAGEEVQRWEASHPSWSKWRMSFPTSPHWYDSQRLAALITGYVGQENGDGNAMTVREFVSRFHGLRRPPVQKAVVEQAGLRGCQLRDMIQNDTVSGAAELLAAMQEHSRPVQPRALGILGHKHLEDSLTRLGAVLGSFRYKKVELIDGGLPFVIEVAFGQHDDAQRGRTLITGLNWSPTITSDFVNELLAGPDIESDDPVLLAIHVAAPRFDLVSHGKAHVVLPEPVKVALAQSIESVCRPWTIAKKRNQRERRAAAREMDRARLAHRGMSIKAAAWAVMRDAYLKASKNNTLPANSRQVMYAARREVLELTGGKIWKRSSYFTQHLLPDFVEQNPALTGGWDVVFDDRGHISEPHVGLRLGIGTVSIRNYIGNWTDEVHEALEDDMLDGMALYVTKGPANRYRFVLFVEKEGFDSLLAAANIAERYDLAIMSTKGMSVTACRELVQELSKAGVTILLAHDFDSWGCTIASTISHDTRRFRFEVPPRVIDLGLRLSDIREMALQSEPVQYLTKKDPREQLRGLRLGTGKGNRLSAAEINMLVSHGRPKFWSGQRVELNAMPADVFIAWLERKLEQAGVRKLVPDDDVLAAAWHRQRKLVELEAQRQRINSEYSTADNPPPADLRERVDEILRRDPTLSWDLALAEVAN